LINVNVCLAGVVFSEGQGDCEGLQLPSAKQYYEYQSGVPV